MSVLGRFSTVMPAFVTLTYNTVIMFQILKVRARDQLGEAASLLHLVLGDHQQGAGNSTGLKQAEQSEV